MLTAAMVLAVLAAALHVLIFYMESIAWEGPLVRKTFGGTPEEARPHAFYAFNQGFYNLFLAVVTGLGVALSACGAHAGGGGVDARRGRRAVRRLARQAPGGAQAGRAAAAGRRVRRDRVPVRAREGRGAEPRADPGGVKAAGPPPSPGAIRLPEPSSSA